jgi:hypothetical protein
VLYPDVLKLVSELGFEKIGRQTTDNLDLVLIGKPRAPIPYYNRHYELVLEDGDNSDIDDEVVAGLVRWIKRYQN